MINIPITKILFLDIETVGITKNYQDCVKEYPRVAEQFVKYIDWFQKRFPEDSGSSLDEIFARRTALVPEFAKIVCVSVAFVMDNNEVKKQTFSNEFELKTYAFKWTCIRICLSFILFDFHIVFLQN